MSQYKEYGFTSEEPSHTFNYLQDELLKLLSGDKSTAILDLGCGNGYLVSYLIDQGYQAYGTDASKEGIDIARKRFPDRFFLQDLSSGQLPEPLQGITFNTIIATEVIEHLYDPEGFIDFCKACLPKKGELIITTPYHGYAKNLMLSLLDKWDSHMPPTWHGGHIKLWSKATLSGLLTSKGFEVIAFRGCGRVPFFWKSMIIKARLL
jgi:2-polyprenyl-3-methyl-5-hydroxy-6-metoxy-1,4-benzoquinol methylase